VPAPVRRLSCALCRASRAAVGPPAAPCARRCPAQRSSCDLSAGRLHRRHRPAHARSSCASRACFATACAGAGGRTSVFPRLDGVGPTFDARGSRRCCETRAISPAGRTRLRTTTRAAKPHTLLHLDDAVQGRRGAPLAPGMPMNQTFRPLKPTVAMRSSKEKVKSQSGLFLQDGERGYRTIISQRGSAATGPIEASLALGVFN
jgi:hypothetical protein